jgi:hypothetical protein
LDGRVFYIRKGNGNRVLRHVIAAEPFPEAEEVNQKLGLIRRSALAARR